MKQFLIFALLFMVGGLKAQEKIEELELNEIRTYTPQKSGVTDLVFEARIYNLAEMLSIW